jgi:hypothetical protein
MHFSELSQQLADVTWGYTAGPYGFVTYRRALRTVEQRWCAMSLACNNGKSLLVLIRLLAHYR